MDKRYLLKRFNFKKGIDRSKGIWYSNLETSKKPDSHKNIFGVTCYEDVMFILIADGHSALPNRYICFNDASLRIMVVAQEK